MLFLIKILAVFFTVNMGGASFAASFAAAYGGKALKRTAASVLFLTFCVLGAVTFGGNVTRTLGQGIAPLDYNINAVLIVFLSAGLSMFVSNVMRIPQSTSLVTVGAIAGVGAYYGELNLKTLYFMLPFWILLPLISFLLTYAAGKYIYPPRKTNFWLYEKIVNNRERLKWFLVITSCYNAFAVGTNNVPNVVGPYLLGMHEGGSLLLFLFIFAVVYGIGAWIFTGPLKTAGEQIVPLGLMTASIISLVSGTLMIIASYFGVPQSFVMLQVGAIFAIGSLKHGKYIIAEDPVIAKTFYTWTINPIITFFLSLGLCRLIL